MTLWQSQNIGLEWALGAWPGRFLTMTLSHVRFAETLTLRFSSWVWFLFKLKPSYNVCQKCVLSESRLALSEGFRVPPYETERAGVGAAVALISTVQRCFLFISVIPAMFWEVDEAGQLLSFLILTLMHVWC